MDIEQQFADGRAEMRSVAFTDVEVSKDGWAFEGLAAVYDQEADLGDFTESMNRGSMRKVIGRGDNVPMLYHHNSMLPVLATTRSGTLTLKDDVKGLRVKADMAQHYVGEAVRELVKRGDIAGMSPGFIVGAGNSRIEHRGGKPHRSIMDFKALLDVSPTWDPAYPGTSAELRSLMAAGYIDQAQQLLSGAVPQLEDGAPVEPAEPAEPGEATPAACEHGDDCELPECHAAAGEQDAEPVEGEAPQEEQRSGVTAVQAAAAARRRRLQMMGLSLPKEVVR